MSNVNMSGFEKLVSSSSILTEDNTKRIGVNQVTVFNDKTDATTKMRIQYASGDTIVLDNLTDMQTFVDEAVVDINVLDKIRDRIQGVRLPVYGKKKQTVQ